MLADSAYGTGELPADLAERGHMRSSNRGRCGPPSPGGFTIDDFTVDEPSRTVTCPNGVTRPITRTGCARRSAPPAPTARCATDAPPPAAAADAVDPPPRRAASAPTGQAADPDFQDVYRQHRPMVERSIAWLTRGNRRLRYRGTIKNDHWLHHRVAALNLRRLITLGLTHNGTWALA